MQSSSLWRQDVVSQAADEMEVFVQQVESAVDALFGGSVLQARIQRILQHARQAAQKLIQQAREENVAEFAFIPLREKESQEVRRLLSRMLGFSELPPPPFSTVVSVSRGQPHHPAPSLLFTKPLETDNNFSSVVEEVRSVPVKFVFLEHGQQRHGDLFELFRKAGTGLAFPVVLVRIPEELEEARESARKKMSLWQRVVPGKLQEPVVLSMHDPEKARSRLMQLVQMNIDRKSGSAVAQAINTLLEQARLECRELLLARLSRALQKQESGIQTAEENLVNNLRELLLDPSPRLQARIRHSLRLSLLKETPPWCLPYRSILGMLTLTAGAWDRLALASLGSTFSSLRVAWQGIRNVKEMGQLITLWNKEALRRCRAHVRKTIRETLKDVKSSLEKEVQQAGEQKTGAKKQTQVTVADFRPDVHISSLEEAVERSRQLFDEEIERSTPRRWGRWLARLATLWFVVIASGPFVASYTQYFASCLSGWSFQEHALEKLPVFSWGQLFSIFLHSVIPVVVIAFWAATRVATPSRIQEVEDQLRESHKQLSSEFEEAIRIRLEDPRLEAMRRLHHLLNVPPKEEEK